VGPFYDNFSEIPREILAIEWTAKVLDWCYVKRGPAPFFSKFVMNCDHRSDESGASIALKSIAERGRIEKSKKKLEIEETKKVRAKLPPSQPPPPVRLTPKTTHFTDNIPISMGNHRWGPQRKNWQKRKESFVNKSSNGSGKIIRNGPAYKFELTKLITELNFRSSSPTSSRIANQ